MLKRPQRWLLLVSLLLFYIVLFSIHQEHRTARKIFNSLPFSYQHRVESFAFHDSDKEQQCWNGTIESTSQITGPIPKVVHILWGLKDPKRDPKVGQFNFLNWLAIRAALMSIKPERIELHYTYLDEENKWFQKIKNNLTLVYHDPIEFRRTSQRWRVASQGWHVAHMADVVRLQILEEKGGIYLDSDIFALHSFDNIIQGARDVVMGFEGGNRDGAANALILAKKGSPFISRWLENYDTSFQDRDWNYHSVILPAGLAKKHPNELCILSPTAFFWPTWTDKHIEYMHTELTGADREKLKLEISRKGGSLYDNQLAYHAWSHLASKYLDTLTPEAVKTKDTPFNMLMRRFLE